MGLPLNRSLAGVDRRNLVVALRSYWIASLDITDGEHDNPQEAKRRSVSLFS